MKPIPSAASAPATDTIQCGQCLGVVRIPAGAGNISGSCPFCRTLLSVNQAAEPLPPIPVSRPVPSPSGLALAASEVEMSPAAQPQSEPAQVPQSGQWYAQRVAQSPFHQEAAPEAKLPFKKRPSPEQYQRVQPMIQPAERRVRKKRTSKKKWGLGVAVVLLLAAIGISVFLMKSGYQFLPGDDRAADDRMVSDLPRD